MVITIITISLKAFTYSDSYNDIGCRCSCAISHRCRRRWCEQVPSYMPYVSGWSSYRAIRSSGCRLPVLPRRFPTGRHSVSYWNQIQLDLRLLCHVSMSFFWKYYYFPWKSIKIDTFPRIIKTFIYLCIWNKKLNHYDGC